MHAALTCSRTLLSGLVILRSEERERRSDRAFKEPEEADEQVSPASGTVLYSPLTRSCSQPDPLTNEEP